MATALLLAAGCTRAPETNTPSAGPPPHYGPARSSAMPNAAAIQRRLWVPALDEGFDPQGIAWAEGRLLVSGYLTTSFADAKGPCRVYRLDADTGAVTGRLDLPPPCGHAGGIAYTGDGTVYVADTATLFAFPLAGAFDGAAPVVRQYPLGPGLSGGLASAAGDALWIGTYEQDGPGRLYEFAAATLAGLAEGSVLTPAMAARSLAIPDYAQGAASDPDGRHLWVSRSGIGWATLDVLDRETGAAVARYPAPAGLEGLDFDPSGRLWTLSEAGARRFYSMLVVRLFFPFNPLILALDPARLARP